MQRTWRTRLVGLLAALALLGGLTAVAAAEEEAGSPAARLAPRVAAPPEEPGRPDGPGKPNDRGKPDHAGPKDPGGEDPGPDPDDPSTWPVQPSAKVRQPEVEGPTSGGIRTGEPYGTTLIPLPEGWMEEEYFFGGTARAPGELSDPDAPGTAFKSRILVRRPVDPAEFNGTVVVDWNNVTIPADRDVAWQPLHPTLLERGFAYVSVAAQRLSIEASPLALKQWDPVRYGSLRHPGDDYSWDIFSQAAEAVLSVEPGVLGDLRPYVERRLAMGASQSGSRLRSYIDDVHAQAEVFDGFQPQISGPGSVRRDLVPILWVNSGGEAEDVDESAPDSDLFRLWEVAGTAHTSNGSSSYMNAQVAHAHSNGATGKDGYDHESGGAWGYENQPGECLRANYYIAGYVWSAALVALDTWVRTGEAPAPMPRYERDESGRLYDEHGNVRGGVRTPLLDVPIAAYFGGDVPTGSTDPCANGGGRMALSGWTRLFSAEKLAELYPTPEAYVEQFHAAVDDALARGFILPEGAEDLKRRAVSATQILERSTALLTIPGGD
jgi:hypothetical protein